LGVLGLWELTRFQQLRAYRGWGEQHASMLWNAIQLLGMLCMQATCMTYLGIKSQRVPSSCARSTGPCLLMGTLVDRFQILDIGVGLEYPSCMTFQYI
jgi:hypothetical protein